MPDTFYSLKYIYNTLFHKGTNTQDRGVFVVTSSFTYGTHTMSVKSEAERRDTLKSKDDYIATVLLENRSWNSAIRDTSNFPSIDVGEAVQVSSIYWVNYRKD